MRSPRSGLASRATTNGDAKVIEVTSVTLYLRAEKEQMVATTRHKARPAWSLRPRGAQDAGPAPGVEEQADQEEAAEVAYGRCSAAGRWCG